MSRYTQPIDYELYLDLSLIEELSGNISDLGIRLAAKKFKTTSSFLASLQTFGGYVEAFCSIYGNPNLFFWKAFDSYYRVNPKEAMLVGTGDNVITS